MLLGLAQLPFMLCIGLFHVTKLLLFSRSDAAWRKPNEFDDACATGTLDDSNGLVDITLNAAALRAFAVGLRGQFQGAGPVMGTGVGAESRVGSPGWHTHTDFFCPFFPVDLTIGLGPDRLEMTRGTYLFASQAHWWKITECWLAAAEANEPCLFVLDADQTEWCTEDSTGRLLLELCTANLPATRT